MLRLVYLTLVRVAPAISDAAWIAACALFLLAGCSTPRDSVTVTLPMPPIEYDCE
jgi:uncharacterized lipoprotein YajG